MSLKLKALGLGLLAIVATSAFAVVNAGASTGGHFVSDVAHTTIVGTESGNHRLHFTPDGTNEQIGCNSASYSGTTVNLTETQIEVTPSYSGCTTTSNGAAVTVTHNECKYRFTVAVGGTNGTADLNCPANKAIEIHHPNCTITVADEDSSGPVNQNLPGIHYTTTVETKHAITLHVNVTFKTQYHGGICIFLGTNQFGELKGSVTVKGTDTAGNQVNITTT